MSRPDTMLEWATVVDADHPGRVEPNAGKKAVGFDDGEAPAASEHNWLFGLTGDWIRWFDDALSTILTLLPNVALRTTTNLFEAGQQINSENAQIPALASTKTPFLEDPLNVWRGILEFPCDDTRSFRLFYGSDDASGLVALTVNAYWNTGTYLWQAEDIAQPSFALLLKRQGISTRLSIAASERPAGAGTWPAWPGASGDVSAGGDFYYETVRVRQTQLNVLAFVPLSGTWTVGAISGAPEAGGAGDEMCIPFLRLPHGAFVNRIHVLHAQTSSAANELHVLARRKFDWPAPGAVTPPATALPAHGVSEVRADIVGPSSSGTHYSTSAAGGFTIDNYSETYVLQCIAGAAGNALPLAVLVEWQDVGPTNQ